MPRATSRRIDSLSFHVRESISLYYLHILYNSKTVQNAMQHYLVLMQTKMKTASGHERVYQSRWLCTKAHQLNDVRVTKSETTKNYNNKYVALFQ